jgi:hypothetical protein
MSEKGKKCRKAGNNVAKREVNIVEMRGREA